jgi:hypothetical protein
MLVLSFDDQHQRALLGDVSPEQTVAVAGLW